MVVCCECNRCELYKHENVVLNYMVCGCIVVLGCVECGNMMSAHNL